MPALLESPQARYSAPSPMQGEGYAQFVFRAHQELMPYVQNPDARNQAVWGCLGICLRKPDSRSSKRAFPARTISACSEYLLFHEHDTKSRDGTPLRYDFNALAELVDTNNKRADTDAYSAIASHHTSDHLKGPKHEPTTVGFAGPYSLGMVGRLNPKWAVFADEHHRTDEADLFDRRRRRSVEVMRFKDGRPSYFDPIATLGADSPRLALPVARYEAEDAIVERYSVIAPVSVGAGNTFIPNTDDKYASTEQGEPPKMMSGQLGEQDIMAIVQAIRNTPEMQWVTSQMQQAIPADQPGPTDGMQAPSPDSQLQLSPDQGPPQAPAMPERNSQCPPPMPAPQPSPTLPQGMAGAGLGQQYAGRYSQLEDEEVTNEQYQALREENEVLAERYSELASNYESLQTANARMVEDYGKMKSAVVQLSVGQSMPSDSNESRNCTRSIRTSSLSKKKPNDACIRPVLR